MSWNGFKKAANRAGTTLMQKAGMVEKTIDREYDDEERKYKSLETKCEKLHREAKGYLDSLRAMTQSQLRIAETLDHFYDETAPMGLAGMKYKDMMAKLDEEARGDFDVTYRETVLGPIGRFCSYFPEINSAIRQREKKSLDYDAMRAKVRKLVDKPSDDSTKLPKAEADSNRAREMYEKINHQLVTDLPKLVDLRIPYFDPSFEALVKSQLHFCNVAKDKLDGLGTYLPPDGENIDGRVEGVLQQMRDLTICGVAA